MLVSAGAAEVCAVTGSAKGAPAPPFVCCASNGLVPVATSTDKGSQMQIRLPKADPAWFKKLFTTREFSEARACQEANGAADPVLRDAHGDQDLQSGAVAKAKASRRPEHSNITFRRQSQFSSKREASSSRSW